MIAALYASVQGINAGLAQLAVSANNVANSSTAGFKGKTLRPAEGRDGGVIVDLESDRRPGPIYPGPGGGVVEGSNVEFGDEAVRQAIAQYAVAENAAVYKVLVEASGTLLDLTA